jgi:hypothetical protein
MEYKQFIVNAFERALGKWRASVERANGRSALDDQSQFKNFPTKFALRSFRTKFASTGQINNIAAARE